MKETHVLPAYVGVRAAQHIYDADAKRFPGRERIRKHIENEVRRGHGANEHGLISLFREGISSTAGIFWDLGEAA